MKKAILAVVALAAWGGVQAASAGDHPLLGCVKCRGAHVQEWLSKVAPHFVYHSPHSPVMEGNAAFGPCGHVAVPGPWYTYWPCGHQLVSQYQMPGWTYLHHFQTPAPIAAGGAYGPSHGPAGFAGVPYYWSGR